jgi:chromate transporter
MKDSDLWLHLLWQFMLLSLVAVGGANAALPEIHRQVVEIGQWMTDRQFSELFAIAQAAPGPNVIVVTLIGWKVAGSVGAVVTTIGMCGPSSIIAFLVEKLSYRFNESTAKKVLQKSFAPITIGIVLASGYLLATGLALNWKNIVIIAVTVCIMLFTQLNLIWMLLVGALLGMLGLV